MNVTTQVANVYKTTLSCVEAGHATLEPCQNNPHASTHPLRPSARPRNAGLGMMPTGEASMSEGMATTGYGYAMLRTGI